MNQTVKAGLYTVDQTEIPLISVDITVDIKGHYSQVSIKQKFRNHGHLAIEATYLFPVQDGSAIHSFKAYNDEKEIIGKVMEREEAFDQYDEAIAEGHLAYLIDQERSNVLYASIGNLAPEQEVMIEVSYFHALDIVDHKSRLLIPTVVAPKYIPQSMETRHGMSEHERWNSPRISEAPYHLNLTVNLTKLGEFISLDSPSHPIKTKLHSAGAQVELSQRNCTLDRDFILEFELESINQAYFVENQHGRFMSILYHAPSESQPKRLGREVIFMLDTSSSMAGVPIEEGINALSLLLRQLDQQDYFNIIFFDSSFQMLWPSVQAYNQEHLDYALQHLAQTYASGGTDILDPLQMLTNTKVKEGLSRQIVLLTDGAVGNEQEIIQLCRQRSAETTIFTFGIGNYVSESLVKGIAKATNGSAEFIHSGERIEPKVLRVIQKLGSKPCHVNVHWQAEVESQFDQSRFVFSGESIQVFARMKDEQPSPKTIIIELDGQKHELEIQSLSTDQQTQSHAISALWARQRMEYLESNISLDLGSLQDRPRSRKKKKTRDEQLKESIISLAVRYQLMSPFTSYVAVEKRSTEDALVGGMKLKPIPLLSAPLLHSSIPLAGLTSYLSPKPSNRLFESMHKFSDSSPSTSDRFFKRIYNKVGFIKDYYLEKPQDEPSNNLFLECSDVFSKPLEYNSKNLPSKLDLLFLALSFQQANGLFTWDNSLTLFFGDKQPSEIQKKSTYEVSTLVIARLESEYHLHVDLWRTAVNKAKAQLQSTPA